MPFTFELIIIFFMIVFNAVFAAYEMALASISHSTLEVLASQKRKGAQSAVYMKDRMESSLAVVQVGITLFGATAAATGGAGIEESFAPYLEKVLGMPEAWAEILAILSFIIPLTCFTIIFGELIPKVFALKNREWVCLQLSPLMKTLSVITYPVIGIFEEIVKRAVKMGSKRLKLEERVHHSLSELKAAAGIARSSRIIGAREEKIVLSAIELTTQTALTVMIPSSEIHMIPANSTLEQALIKAHLEMHTRFPVCEKEGDPQTIVGYVNFKDIISALKTNPENPSIKGITRLINSIKEDERLSDALGKMIHDKAHIALVRSKTNQVVGLIALEDIIEELVGEIEDEFDRLPVHIQPIGDGWIAGGGVPMDTVAEKLNAPWVVDKSQPRVPNLAEWFASHLWRAPVSGEMVELDSLRITARKLRRKKLYEGILSVLPSQRS